MTQVRCFSASCTMLSGTCAIFAQLGMAEAKSSAKSLLKWPDSADPAEGGSNGPMWTHVDPQNSSMFIKIVTLCHFISLWDMCGMKRPDYMFCVKHNETIHLEKLRNFDPCWHNKLHGFIVTHHGLISKETRIRRWSRSLMVSVFIQQAADLVLPTKSSAQWL